MDNKLKMLLEVIVEHNYTQLEKVAGDQGRAKNLITLFDDREGVEVFDPFLDTTLRVSVNPIEEYGLKRIREFVDNWDQLTEE